MQVFLKRYLDIYKQIRNKMKNKFLLRNTKNYIQNKIIFEHHLVLVAVCVLRKYRTDFETSTTDVEDERFFRLDRFLVPELPTD